MSTGKAILGTIRQQANLNEYRKKHWEGSLEQYLDIVREHPEVTRTAYQRLYDMILSHGTEEIYENKEKLIRYKFFTEFAARHADSIFGLDRPLMQLANTFKSAAKGYGTERRVLLLHGPVGSSKSTIARLLKRGLERYSRIEEGALFTYGWKNDDGSVLWCPMHEEPLNLVPNENRAEICRYLNEGHDLQNGRYYGVEITGELCPLCRFVFRERLERLGGDWTKVVDQVVVKRLVLSEQDRIGIGTFQPKDEKNQDSTELTGDINYRKIAEYGTESDPRAFNFDGELNIANRGLVEFIEVLKLDVAFLYDLLGASQEHKIKPKKFAQTDIDEVILGHTNEAEYKKLLNNEFMEALRDRTIKIDIPYITKLTEEIRIYEKDFSERKIKNKHIAPHTLEVAAMWAVMTRLEDPKKLNLSLMQKMKLYDGKVLPGYTQDTVKELRKESKREGMEGISPRYVQDKISNALVNDQGEGTINPFMVLNELDKGLRHHSLITSEEQRKRYQEIIGLVKREYEEIVKNEVQRAISADEDAIAKLAGNYIDNIKAYALKEKVKNRYTGQDEEPDERLMRSIEEKIEIPENRKDD